MRKSARAIVLVFLAFLTTIGLTVAAAMSAAITLAATTALIVPGTGTPNANIVDDYLSHAVDRFIAPFDPTCTSTNGCNYSGINYPASFWPLGFIGNWCPGYSCDTWNVSVGTGVANLHTALTNATSPVDIFGYSQGGAVVSTELNNIRNNPALLAKINSVVTIGGIENPDGGLWARLSFIPYVPILNITPHPAMPVDLLPGKITTVGFQYDPVSYAPLFWGNPISLLNAIAALETVHGFYLTPNGNGPTDPIAYGYTPEELLEQMNCTTHAANCRFDQYNNTYIMIPARSLPLTDFVMSLVPSGLAPIVKPFADLVTPVLKVIADLGYDWSGNPGQVRWLSPLPFNPFQNWFAVGANLIVAAVQGVQAFLGDLGGLAGASTLAPATTGTGSTMLTKSFVAPKTGDEPQPGEEPKDLKPGDELTGKTSLTGTTSQSLTETKQDETKLDGSKLDGSRLDATKLDETKLDATKLDETKLDATKLDETKKDATKLDETKKDATKLDETKKDVDETKKDANGGSVSLNFSPKPTTPTETGGATAGQTTGQTTTPNTEPPTGTEPAKAAA